MTVSAADQSPFQYANGIFPDNYFGQTEPVTHHLPIFSDGGDTPAFQDVLVTINPLQHIPLISTIDRAITGDVPAAGARIVGGALYGGPVGLFASLVDSAIDDNTGQDIGDHAVAMAEDALGMSPSGGGGATKLAAAAAPQVAAVDPPPTAQPPPEVAEAQPPPPLAAPQPQVSAAPIKGAAVAPAPLPAAATAAAMPPPPAGAKAMPLARAAPMRFMPAPQRQPVQPVQPPPITVPLSNDGEMSHVPITGRPSHMAVGPSPAAVHRVLVSEGQANTPLGAGPPGMTAPGALPTPAGQDWFTAAMTSALDKYQKSQKLAAPPATALPGGAALPPAAAPAMASP